VNTVHGTSGLYIFMNMPLMSFRKGEKKKEKCGRKEDIKEI
jgi:hypothetical protein